MSKPPAAIPADKLALYEKLVATNPRVERKGAAQPDAQKPPEGTVEVSEDGSEPRPSAKKRRRRRRKPAAAAAPAEANNGVTTDTPAETE